MSIMFYMEEIRTVFGWAGACFTIYSFIIPIYPFFQLLKGKIYFEEAPGALAFFNYLNCFCWYLFGDLIYSTQLKYMNLFGAFINFISLCIYLLYESKKYKVDTILNSIIIISGSYLIYQLFYKVIENDDTIAKTCNFTFIFTFIFPCINIYRVIQKKSYVLINYFATCLSMIGSISWIVYAYFTFDFYIAAPYCIKMIIDGIQIFLYIKYRTKYSKIEEGIPSPSTIGIETNESNENDDNKSEENTKMKIDDDLTSQPVKIIEKPNL